MHSSPDSDPRTPSVLAVWRAGLGLGVAALLIVSYDVSDADRYAEYNPGSLEAIMATVGKHGGQPLAAGPPEVVMGSMEHTAVCISFPDAGAAKAWLNDDEYAPLKAIRHGATSNIKEYIVPGLG